MSMAKPDRLLGLAAELVAIKPDLIFALGGLLGGAAALGPPGVSLDHLVGAGEQRAWNLKAQRLCALEIDH
jgi:hypothetical protein